VLQFFYAMASSKSSNIIVLCLAQIMASISEIIFSLIFGVVSSLRFCTMEIAWSIIRLAYFFAICMSCVNIFTSTQFDAVSLWLRVESHCAAALSKQKRVSSRLKSSEVMFCWRIFTIRWIHTCAPAGRHEAFVIDLWLCLGHCAVHTYRCSVT